MPPEALPVRVVMASLSLGVGKGPVRACLLVVFEPLPFLTDPMELVHPTFYAENQGNEPQAG